MHTVEKSGTGEVVVIPAPFDLGQGRGAQTTFLLSHGVTLGAVGEPDQNGGAGFEEPVCQLKGVYAVEGEIKDWLKIELGAD